MSMSEHCGSDHVGLRWVPPRVGGDPTLIPPPAPLLTSEGEECWVCPESLTRQELALALGVRATSIAASAWKYPEFSVENGRAIYRTDDVDSWVNSSSSTRRYRDTWEAWKCSGRQVVAGLKGH